MKRNAQQLIETLGKPHRGSFFRNVALEYQETPLDAIGSCKTGGRYNKKGAFEILYAAADLETALLETGAVLRAPDGTLISVRRQPIVTITIDIELQNVVDLRDAAIRTQLGLSEGDLYVPWRDLVADGKSPVTQRIGNIARAAAIEALIVPSDKNRGKANLAIIDSDNNLLVGSTVDIYDPKGFHAAVSTTIKGKKRP